MNKWNADNGTIGDYSSFWLSVEDTDVQNNSFKLLKEFTKEMNVVEFCFHNNMNNCGGIYPSTDSSNRMSSLNITRAVLPDGMFISLQNSTRVSRSCYNSSITPGVTIGSNICGYIIFDVNGLKGPNKTGYDYFEIAYQVNGFSSTWYTRGDLEYTIIYDKLSPDIGK